MNKNQEFLELLRLNNNLRLHKWLVENGKTGKPFAAVMFEKKEKPKKKEEEL